MTGRTIRLALLLCDTPLPEVREKLGVTSYHAIFDSHLQHSLRTFPDASRTAGVTLQVDSFDVVNEQNLPSNPEDYDVIMMTGSAHSAYETGKPWLAKLVDFIRSICTEERYKDLKVIGTCFGMQVIAVALGAGCVPNQAGWEIGVYEIALSEHASRWLTPLTDQPPNTMFIQEMHRDQVPHVPEGFHPVGTTDKCKVQGFLQYFSDSDRRIRVIGLQGHPEFTKEIVDKMVDVRSASGVFDQPTTEEARWRSGWQQEGQGHNLIGWGYIAIMLD